MVEFAKSSIRDFQPSRTTCGVGDALALCFSGPTYIVFGSRRAERDSTGCVGWIAIDAFRSKCSPVPDYTDPQYQVDPFRQNS